MAMGNDAGEGFLFSERHHYPYAWHPLGMKCGRKMVSKQPRNRQGKNNIHIDVWRRGKILPKKDCIRNSHHASVRVFISQKKGFLSKVTIGNETFAKPALGSSILS